MVRGGGKVGYMGITPNPPLIEYVKPILSQNISNIDTHPLLRRLLKSIAGGRKPSQDLFTDDKHYSFFLDTVMRQLNMKTYTKMPDTYKYRYQTCISYDNVIRSMYNERRVSIFYDPRYVMFLFNADIMCFEQHGDGTIGKDYLGIHSLGYPRTYLVGVNDDGKLFTIRVIPDDEAERLEVPGIIARNEYAWLLNVSDITKLNTTVSSNIVHRAPSKDILIYSRGTYRVQGDLLIRYDPYEDNYPSEEKLLVEMVFRRVRNLFEDYIRVLLEDMIMRALFNMGLTPERARSYIYINDIIPSGVSPKYKIEVLTSLAYELTNHLNKIYSAKYEVIFTKVYWEVIPSIKIVEDDYTVAVIAVDTRYIRGVYSRKTPIAITIDTGYAGIGFSQLYRQLSEELRNELNNIEPTTIEVVFGNHLVRLENVYGSIITYTPSIQPKILSERSINIELNEYIVCPRTLVKIYHPQHGVTQVRFTRVGTIEIMTLFMDENMAAERNRSVVRAIRRKIMRDPEIKKLVNKIIEINEVIQ
jgi:hypothetical protein